MMTEQEKREKVIKGLECCQIGCDSDCPYYTSPSGDASICRSEMEKDALALLKAQEPVKPILARGWYWCGGIGCRGSLTSAIDNDAPAHKPNYCERCGRAVKWG